MSGDVDVVVDRALINVLQGGAKGSGGGIRHYRLVDQQGCPHPVLDDLYDSLDAAWDEARQWWREHVGADREPVGIGIEVSTACGSWRTLRYPGC
jgi:hypothetical protein